MLIIIYIYVPQTADGMIITMAGYFISSDD